MSLLAALGETVTLAEVLEDGNESVYPQAEVYLPGEAVPTAVIDLNHIVKGRYEGAWVPSVIGLYTVLFIVYADASHTVENIVYTRESEQVSVRSSNIDMVSESIQRLLGLNHENVFIDNTTFDVSDQLISARIRIFDSRANALAATDGGSETTGLIATYQMTSVYESVNKMGSYRMVKE